MDYPSEKIVFRPDGGGWRCTRCESEWFVSDSYLGLPFRLYQNGEVYLQVGSKGGRAVLQMQKCGGVDIDFTRVSVGLVHSVRFHLAELSLRFRKQYFNPFGNKWIVNAGKRTEDLTEGDRVLVPAILIIRSLIIQGTSGA